MVMMVEAGAVAQPMAPSSSEKGRDSPNSSMTMVISTPAVRDSNRVRITTLIPLFFRAESLKYLPTPKAMKASATSVMKSIWLIYSWGTRCRHQGPIKTPDRIYPVTLGRCASLVSLVNRNPEISIIAAVRMIPEP